MKPFDDNCEMCGRPCHKRKLITIHGIRCCRFCKRGKASFYSKKVYIPLVKRSIKGIDFSQVEDSDIRRIIISLNRPILNQEKKLLWKEYMDRGLSELQAKDRLNVLINTCRNSHNTHKERARQINQSTSFRDEFNKLIQVSTK